MLLGGGPEDSPEPDDDCAVMASPAPKANLCPVFTSPGKAPRLAPNQKVARLMTSPAMARVMGQQAHTPEAQALARDVAVVVVSQSPDLQVASHQVPQYEPGKLSIAPGTPGIHRPGANPGGRPVTGKRVGRGGQFTPELKKNKKIPGMTQLRRDCGAAVRLQIAQELTKYGVKTRADLKTLGPAVWARLQDRWPRPRKFLKDCWINQDKYQVALGSLRAKGCGFRKQAPETAGSRISSQPKDQASKKVPLQGVYWRTRLWLRKEASTYAYPRPAQMMSQFKLFLVHEMGVQRALLEADSPVSQPWVLKACEEKLQLLTSHKQKQIQDFQSRVLLPAIGARRRRGQKLNKDQGIGHNARVMCQVQWQTTDYTYYVNQASDPEVLKTFVEDPESWAKHRSQTWLVESDATALWLQISGQEGVLVPGALAQRNSQHRRLF